VNSSRNYGKDISIGFEVDSIDAFMGVLKEKGIELESGPYQPNPVIKFIYVLDPNGFRVQFIPFFRRSVLTFLPPRRLVSISRIYLFISRNFTLSVALKAF